MPEDPQNGDNPNEQRPDWLPENFNSPEDLLRSYQESQRKITEQGTQLSAMNESFAELSQQIEELTAAQQRPTVADQGDATTRWQEMYDNDPLGTIALLNQQMLSAEMNKLREELSQQTGTQAETQEELVATFVANEMSSRYDDWDEMQETLRAELERGNYFDDPSVRRTPAAALARMEQAYFVAKGRGIHDGTIKPPTQDARQMKLQAQGISGSGARPDPVDAEKEAWDRVKAAGASTYADLMSPR